MDCPRLDHFVRFNPNRTLSRCGHMVNAPKFNNLDDLDNSPWLSNVKLQFMQNQWPSECIRCCQTEESTQQSVRLDSIKFHQLQERPDYLVVGGVLDNICNSACQFCNDRLSTTIGVLTNRNLSVNNTNGFWSLPQHRIVHLDINGGEPSVSKNYREVLKNLPKSVTSVRVNTNCSVIINELEELVSNGIQVTVTVSFDGVGSVHDYVRWPIKWDKFCKNLMTYKNMPVRLNLWTTVNALNINNIDQIFSFVEDNKLDHSWAMLHNPNELNIGYSNHLTTSAKEKFKTSTNSKIQSIINLTSILSSNQNELDAYIKCQDHLRNIDINTYIIV